MPVLPELPPIPRPFVDQANALYRALQASRATFGEQLHMVYLYMDSFQPYLAQFTTCSKGCSHCCRIDVQITTLEAENIWLYTRRPAQPTGPITTGHKTPCPFLSKDGACSIYAERPLICRIYHVVGEPSNCASNSVVKQIHYGHPPSFGNDIFANLVSWTHQVAINNGGTVRDIRDFFPE
jgi:hypothetical protein